MFFGSSPIKYLTLPSAPAKNKSINGIGAFLLMATKSPVPFAAIVAGGGLGIGVARKGNAEELQNHGAHLVVNDLGELVY